MKITSAMKITWGTEKSSVLIRAWKRFQRDLAMTLQESPEGAKQEETLLLRITPSLGEEGYRITAGKKEMLLEGGDELGIIYALLFLSEKFLGVKPFWYWLDQKFVKWKQAEIPEGMYLSPSYAVKYRGWFINDEVLLHTWNKSRFNRESGITENEGFEMAMEALLRLGGNMVIPGTDANSHNYRKLAADMGLWVTHHHAEPLGAPMFARVYPELNPSFAEHPEKFRELWRRGIETQKGEKTVWNLGFRGQGDSPFWANDPEYDTDEKRGALMGELIEEQYRLVKEADPEAVCCTNLYGETMELYRAGCLKLPEDVIKIWADNGYGKMVSRRQGNHNPRVCALPGEEEHGRHGIYYHVSFYDLQAANHMTMLPCPEEFVCSELAEVLAHGVKDYFIINCSNVKPHVSMLDLIAQIWRDGAVNPAEHRERFAGTYFGKENAAEVAGCLEHYARHSLKYGPHEDDRAGEQFANHVIRMLVSQYRRDPAHREEELLWATDAETLRGQTEWYRGLCLWAKGSYESYLQECGLVGARMSGRSKILFEDTVLLQAKLHHFCFTGAYLASEGLLCAMEEDWKKAFYLAGKAEKCYRLADAAMREREHGKWHGFYANECLTDMKQTAWVLKGLMSDLRNAGDGPHFYQWQRDLLYAEEDRRVMLIMNMENHLTDEELFALMEERWED